MYDMYGFFEGIRDTDDPVYLAKMIGRFRRHIGCTTRQAAELIGLPWRTLEAIEQGRGFRYPAMLINSMSYNVNLYDAEKLINEVKANGPTE